MSSDRWSSLSIAVLGAVALAACSSVDVDESDSGELFVDTRIRKELKRSETDTRTHLELGWNSVHGEIGAVDYAIDTLTAGAVLDFPLGTQGRFGVGGGLAWQLNELDTSPVDVDEDDGIGPYGAIECGWLPVHWLEPYARANLAVYLNEVASQAGFELGARFHVIEHATLFAGWRHAWYEWDDVDSNVGFSSVELDVSGAVVGIVLSF